MVEKHQVDTAQIAMSWAIAKGTVPIIGVTKSSHVDGPIAAADVELTNQEVEDLETAAKETGVEVKAVWEQEM